MLRRLVGAMLLALVAWLPSLPKRRQAAAFTPSPEFTTASTTGSGQRLHYRSAPIRTRPTAKGANQVTEAATPTVTLTPTSGKIKTAITVALSGFRSSEAITLKWYDGSAAKTVATGTTSSGGKATITFTAPYAFRGYHTIEATGSRGSKATARFAIVPSFTLFPKAGPAGTTVKASLSGYAAGSVVEVRFFPGADGSGTPIVMKRVTVSGSGTGSTEFVTRQSFAPGNHRVEGREQASGRLASATFQVRCSADSQCPAPATDCSQAVCSNGICGSKPRPSGTVCDDNEGAVCDGHGACVQCLGEMECPVPSNTECQSATCIDGMCGFANVDAGTVSADQIAGDCLTQVCDGNGAYSTVEDPTDTPTVTGACKVGLCVGGSPTVANVQNGEACAETGGTVCYEGECVACTPNTIRACYDGPSGTAGVGICKSGTQSCGSDGSAWGPCNGQMTPASPICNGLDNNCDGMIDTNCPAVPNAMVTCAGSGGCEIATCNMGYANCDMAYITGCETNIASDADNCGACGHKCATGQHCMAGMCS